MAATLTAAGVIHLTAIAPALAIGATMLAMPKGTPIHKIWGRIWLVLMAVADISAFWLQRDGYSWIHVFAVVNLTSITAGAIFIRQYRRRIAHAAFMIGAYTGAVLAGIGALMPGRFLHMWLFGA